MSKERIKLHNIDGVDYVTLEDYLEGVRLDNELKVSFDRLYDALNDLKRDVEYEHIGT